MESKFSLSSLITPYGGKLVNLCVQEEEKEETIRQAVQFPSIQLSQRSVFDLELLATGAFSPLNRFMNEEDYNQVLDQMMLSSGYIFPIPITLPVDDISDIHLNRTIALRDCNNELLATLKVEEIFKKKYKEEALNVYGTLDTAHPLVSEMAKWGKYYVSGDIRVIQLPKYYDYLDLRNTPKQVRAKLIKSGGTNIVAFQTRNPIHRVHEELTKQAAKNINGMLLLHPVVGTTNPGDTDYFTRVRIYKAIYNKYYNHKRTLLSLLPLAMRMAGPREALWHGIIRRNYGANYFIVGRDHASPGKDSRGVPFYKPYEAQKLFTKFSEQIGVSMIPFHELVYVASDQSYQEKNLVLKGKKYYSISGTDIRNNLKLSGITPPSWLSRPETAFILAQAYPPPEQRGFCIWFTGLPSSGKSTVAQTLKVLLQEIGRTVTLLDGDVVRTHLSKGLGYSYEDRETNLLRIAFVASEIVKHNGIVICAAVSPYNAVRERAKMMINPDQFILVYVNTPLRICEKRDAKGYYALARSGKIKHFTGIDDRYDKPASADVILSTSRSNPEKNANKILSHLQDSGYIKSLKHVGS